MRVCIYKIVVVVVVVVAARRLLVSFPITLLKRQVYIWQA